jgi:hypothetical protein
MLDLEKNENERSRTKPGKKLGGGLLSSVHVSLHSRAALRDLMYK